MGGLYEFTNVSSGQSIMLEVQPPGFTETQPTAPTYYAITASTAGSSFPGRDSQLRMDLLTAVRHELGHTLGLDDLHDRGTENDLMYEALAVGIRRTSFAAVEDFRGGR